MSEVDQPLESFRSFRDFFIRTLKPGTRPLSPAPVSPVDGTMRNAGTLTDAGWIEQIKGKTYSATSLLGAREEAIPFVGGTYFHFYLSPRDYHRVHSPVSGNIVRRIHIAADLWPVQDWAIDAVHDLYCTNERVAIILETEEYGRVAVVMVGALNVGSIALSHEPEFSSNRCTVAPLPEGKTHDPGIPVQVGDELGVFSLGSSVVLLFEKFPDKPPVVPGALRMGQSLLSHTV